MSRLRPRDVRSVVRTSEWIFIIFMSRDVGPIRKAKVLLSCTGVKDVAREWPMGTNRAMRESVIRRVQGRIHQSLVDRRILSTLTI